MTPDNKKETTVGTTSEIPLNTKEQRITRYCAHEDGAITVAEYIVEEIKQNVQSEDAKKIRNYLDQERYKKIMDEWSKLPLYARLGGPPDITVQVMLANTMWFNAVKTNSKWDHKPKIRALFKSHAVHRPLDLEERSHVPSESHYHKYKDHDYFYDVWSNIHYGYVGLSVGFSEGHLLIGGSFEQLRTDLFGGTDPIDDVTSIKIGYALYKRFGQYAEQLTAQNVLDALEAASDGQLPYSRDTHWCWHPKNPEPLSKPKEFK